MTAHVANFSMNINDVFAPLYIAVATGAATCQTNTDPKTGSWASRTMPVSTSWIDVAYGAGIIVAISGAASNTYAATTVNGTTWIQRTLPVASTWASLIYGNNKFVAISGTGNHIAYSPDGCSWTYDTISGTNRQWISIAYGNGTYCAIAYSTTADTLYTSVSTDGTTWSNNTATNITCTGQWNKIIYGNGRFVAVCKDSSVSAYSTDGINWTASTLPSSTAWKSVCYGNGIYIAVTETNSDKAAKSTDNAATWSEITLPVASTWRTVIFGKNLINDNVFTCIGATTVSNYSIDDGVTWYAKTQITMTYTAACYAPVTWYSGDSLTIANTGKIDVTTDQNRFWSSMAISNGSLNIENTTQNAISFSMGRITGASAGTITPGSGLGEIVIKGDFIELGTGSGNDSQTVTIPYTDYVAALWIETVAGSNIYEQWVNATGGLSLADTNPILYDGLNAVSSGNHGKFFIQNKNTNITDCSAIHINAITSTLQNKHITRYLKVDSTSNIIPGAQVLGAGLTAGTVVNRVMSSTELELNLPTANIPRTDWSAIAYGASMFVALSTNYSDVYATSTNGVDWTKRTLPLKQNWSGIAYGATSGRFVAICKNSNICLTSSNGIDWTVQYLPNTLNWNSVATNGTSFVIVGATTADAATTVGAYSADGLTWVATVMTSAIWKSVAYGNSRYLAISSTTICNYDTDGAGTWTNGTAVTSANYASIVWNGTRFVAISGSSTITRYTTDGVTWTTGGALPNSNFTSMCWTGSVFIAISTNATLAQTAVTSTDGASWTNISLAVNDLRAICFGGSVTVALAGANATNYAGSAAYTSDANGVSWTLQSGMVSDVSFLVFNPFRSQLTNTVSFGNNINGSKVPVGAKIRCPNIMLTSLTPSNLQTSSNLLGCSFVMTNGGKLEIDTALFDECYHNITQAQYALIENAAFSMPFTLSECYLARISNVVFARQPVRRYFTWPYWYTRDTRYANGVSWSYIDNAIISDLKICCDSPHGRYGTTTAASIINLSYTRSATFNRLIFYTLNPIKANHTGFLLSNLVSNCQFTDCTFYGCMPVNATTCNYNTFDNIIVKPRMFSGKMGLITAGGVRVGIDPETNLDLNDNQKYYIKTRTYLNWSDFTQYEDSSFIASSTPFLGSKWFPYYFSAVPTINATVQLNWVRREPTSGSVAAYEVFRGTSIGFTKNLAARIYTTTTNTNISYTDSSCTPGTKYYYVLRKYDGNLAGITNSSGTSGQTTITTSQNFKTGIGTISGCYGDIGTRKIYRHVGDAPFYASNVWPGMPLTATELDANTTVVSVDSQYEITISHDIISSFSEKTISLGVMAGLYVSGTNVVAGTKVLSVDSTTQITTDTANGGTVSGTLTFLYATESPEVEATPITTLTQKTNYLLYSIDFSNAQWVKTNITVTTGSFPGPIEPAFNASSSYTNLGVLTTSIGPNANMTNTVTGLSIGSWYCLSVYVSVGSRSLYYQETSTISINTTTETTSTFNVTEKWERKYVAFQATATSHIVTLKINQNGAAIRFYNVQVNDGSTPIIPINTTTALAQRQSSCQNPLAAYAWNKSNAGNDKNQGIEIILTALQANALFTEIYLGDSDDFVPSVNNMVDCTINATGSLITLTTSNNNIFKNITQLTKGQTGTVATLTGSSNNKIVDYDYDFDFGASVLLNIQNLSNNNIFHNFNISNFRNYINTSAFTTANNAANNILQNINFDTYDLPLLMNCLNTNLKNVAGGSATPITTITTWIMGGTSDGVGITYTTIYDTNFYELQDSNNTGLLNLIFNDSAQEDKPYTVLFGTPTFSNTGSLFFLAHNDSIEFEWINNIKGVTGFRNINPKYNGVDLGTAVDFLFSLYKEFAIDNGSGYSEYTELTGPNLYAATITNPNIGFKIKIKLTCKTGMKYTSRTNYFVVGEQIKGSTSLATAYIDKVNNIGTAGDVLLSNISGNFIAGEAIVRNSDSQARATNVATNTNFALFPSFTSCINGLQIYTTIDKTIKYSEYIDTISVLIVDTLLQPIENAIVRITAKTTSGGFTVGSVVAIGYTNSNGIMSKLIEYAGDIDVNIRVRKSTGSPVYISSDTPSTVIAGTGLSMTIVMIKDE